MLEKKKLNVFLLFVLVALILILGVVSVQQIRMAQFNKRLTSIEGSVIRMENAVNNVVGAAERFNSEYERAMTPPKSTDDGIQVGIGDRKEPK